MDDPFSFNAPIAPSFTPAPAERKPDGTPQLPGSVEPIASVTPNRDSPEAPIDGTNPYTAPFADFPAPDFNVSNASMSIADAMESRDAPPSIDNPELDRRLEVTSLV